MGVLKKERERVRTQHQYDTTTRTSQPALIEKGEFGNEAIASQPQFASDHIGRVNATGGQTVSDHCRCIALELFSTSFHNLFNSRRGQGVVAVLVFV